MKVFKVDNLVIIQHKEYYYSNEVLYFDSLINKVGLYNSLKREISTWKVSEEPPIPLGITDPPLVSQEIWAAGVTYYRSREARMNESEDSGGSKFYDMVYYADRPELFFKGTLHSCVGHGGNVAIRRDSAWNVPEPELSLFISSSKTIEGYTIGNDMSSRSIEGENPLYLPQAKVYDRSASLGPCLHVTDKPISSNTKIEITITSGQGSVLYENQVEISKIKRSFNELVDYLFLDHTFPKGVYLMTGTCMVPDTNFTLNLGDLVTIKIDGIGTLRNIVTHN